MRVKELVDVAEVETSLTREEMRALRRPAPGFYIERRAATARDLAEDASGR